MKFSRSGSLCFLALAGWSLFCCMAPGGRGETKAADQQGFALVELFTSEGCSSCPPADELVNSIAKDAAANGSAVYILSYHVDYWNRLGWRDPFSDKSFSERQYWYSERFGGDRVYTPQMVINGATEFVGSDKEKAKLGIRNSLEQQVAAPLSLSKGNVTGTGMSVSYVIPAMKPSEALCYALIEKDLNSDIKRGENEGLKLFHSSVVRLFQQLDNAGPQGSFTFSYDVGKKPGKFSVIAFIQNQKTGAIRTAGRLDL